MLMWCTWWTLDQLNWTKYISCLYIRFPVPLYRLFLHYSQLNVSFRNPFWSLLFRVYCSLYDYWIYRTIQTAVGVFGGEGYTDGMDSLPLMVANAGNSGRPAISSLNCPPILAVELCREHLVWLVMKQVCFIINLCWVYIDFPGRNVSSDRVRMKIWHGSRLSSLLVLEIPYIIVLAGSSSLW